MTFLTEFLFTDHEASMTTFKDKLIRSRNQLVEVLSVTEILPALSTAGVISPDECESLKTTTNTRGHNPASSELLVKLSQKGKLVSLNFLVYKFVVWGGVE